MILVGKKAKDIVTGFSGTVTAYHQGDDGDNEILIAPKVSKQGEYRAPRWFDEHRVKFVEEA